jgi:peptidase E
MSWEGILKNKGPPRLKNCPEFPTKQVYHFKRQAKSAQKRIFEQKGIQMHIYTCPYKHIINKRGKTWTHFHLSKKHEIGR